MIVRKNYRSGFAGRSNQAWPALPVLLERSVQRDFSPPIFPRAGSNQSLDTERLSPGGQQAKVYLSKTRYLR